jgi:N-terminal half of MaoC dehydratase
MTSARDVAEWDFVVEAGKLREFARAVHDDHSGGIAPPTFPVYVTAAYVERLVVDILKLDRRRTVHGEQEYEYQRPVRAGDRLRCRARVVEDYVKEGKRGGRMRFVVCETEMRDAGTGELVLRERATAIETAAAEGA